MLVGLPLFSNRPGPLGLVLYELRRMPPALLVTEASKCLPNMSYPFIRT
jgi:hypothetical protein